VLVVIKINIQTFKQKKKTEVSIAGRRERARKKSEGKERGERSKTLL